MSTELQKLLAWWDSLASSKPKGYTLSAVEEKTRRDLINNAIFEIETLGDEQKALDSIEIFKLAATSSPTLSEAKSNAGEVLDALDNLVALGYKANTEQMQRYRSRAQFILSSQTHKRGALTWSDALGCGGGLLGPRRYAAPARPARARRRRRGARRQSCGCGRGPHRTRGCARAARGRR
jgi:hypothetical protein